MTTPENENAFKHLYGEALLKRMSAALKDVHPAFDHKKLITLYPKFKYLEMKARVVLLRDTLRDLLPADYPSAVKILLQSLRTGKLNGFDLWPYTEFVQTFGLEHRELSLTALKDMTKLFTSEWAVRPFIKRYPKETMAYLLRCATDTDVHVRRWASEGTRPRLPWGERLQDFVKDPKPTLAILNALRFDEELYVRKSVANHLNDIAKDNPDFVIEVLNGWQKAAPARHTPKLDWITARALRTLIKDGHRDALKLIGVQHGAKVKVSDFKVTPVKLKVGDRLHFSLQLTSTSTKPQKLVVDYIVHFMKANKKLAPKVFKLKSIDLPAKGAVAITKNHHVKKITTRDYYPGRHKLAIQINGEVMCEKTWDLKL